MIGATSRQRLFAPEVIQTSAMDCGPAALKCLLEGFGIPVSYGRLREACQTDVDGTSIDTIEEIARQLGLNAEQVMLPLDHVLLAESRALPALVVVRGPTGLTHFVVVWRQYGRFVQVMDPASGRRWLTCAQLLKEVYVHKLRVPAAGWHEWARSGEFLVPLGRRLRDLGLGLTLDRLLTETSSAADWKALAALDAATRLTAALVRARAVRKGREAQEMLGALLSRTQDPEATAYSAFPDLYWSVRPAPLGGLESGATPDEELVLKGAVLVRVRGRLATHPGVVAGTATSPASMADETAPPDPPPPLSPELVAALAEPPSRPGRELLRLLRGDGVLSWSVLGGGLFLAAGGVILEAIMLRGAIDIGHSLGLISQRLAAVVYFLAFAAALLLIELQVMGALLGLGRRLEFRLRIAMFDKIPRLMDQYFRSRPISDMAERGHSIHQLRRLPRLGGQWVRAVLTLFVTGAALTWLYPPGALITALAVGLAIGLPLAFKPPLEELDLRARTHTGALMRFYLDALLGLTAVRAHSAEVAVRREQEGLLIEWCKASLGVVRANLALEGLQALSGFGLAVLLLYIYAERGGDPGNALLLAYWALHIPVLGEEVALLLRQYPIHRNLTLRLLEPLGALTEAVPDHAPPPHPPGPRGKDRAEPVSAGAPRACPEAPRGVNIALESVTVHAAGHAILQDLQLRIEAGTHVAIVGASGAGKSSLVGLLLGWHRPAAGRILIDGQPLDASGLERLRQHMVWIDPSVQLWNRTLLDNLSYGLQEVDTAPLSWALQTTELYPLLERLPDGLQTCLGEGGGLVSGGEGQRVRIARGLLRPEARLVILDEPFRGLERALRRQLLGHLRQHWRHATLLCISHDVGETLGFERVLVMQGGRIVEVGPPQGLAGASASCYRALLAADETVRADYWGHPRWRRLRLHQGRFEEEGSGGRGALEAGHLSHLTCRTCQGLPK